VEKERAAIGGNVAMYLKPLFKRRERAPETKDFNYRSVRDGGNVKHRKPGRLRVRNVPKMTQAM
jgi:hypothetical protein